MLVIGGRQNWNSSLSELTPYSVITDKKQQLATCARVKDPLKFLNTV